MQWLTFLASAVALLAGIGTMAAFVAIGAQRGRVERLEHQNEDLRNEVTDVQRRHDREVEDHQHTRSELDTSKVAVEAHADRIRTLETEVATMQRAFDGVTGPLAALSALVQQNATLIESHHTEAMSGMDYMYALQVDALRLLGDKRNPARIRAEMRARDGQDRTQIRDGDDDASLAR